MVYLYPERTDIMINSLIAIENRYNEIEKELATPEVINDIKFPSIV